MKIMIKIVKRKHQGHPHHNLKNLLKVIWIFMPVIRIKSNKIRKLIKLKINFKNKI
jgi:hypothetical protein